MLIDTVKRIPPQGKPCGFLRKRFMTTMQYAIDKLAVGDTVFFADDILLENAVRNCRKQGKASDISSKLMTLTFPLIASEWQEHKEAER